MSEVLSTAQIGKCGELLVQYRLLMLGIEAAPLSTDTGIDLVAYAPGRREAMTIQVKANLRAKPGGGKGKAALDWWVPENSPAQFVALVDLSSEAVWLMSHSELLAHAQQRSGGRAHIYMYTDPEVRPRKADRLSLKVDFEPFLLSQRAADVFGLATKAPEEASFSALDCTAGQSVHGGQGGHPCPKPQPQPRPPCPTGTTSKTSTAKA